MDEIQAERKRRECIWFADQLVRGQAAYKETVNYIFEELRKGSLLPDKDADKGKEWFFTCVFVGYAGE